jgi:hypothetical protein
MLIAAHSAPTERVTFFIGRSYKHLAAPRPEQIEPTIDELYAECCKKLVARDWKYFLFR